MKEIFKIIKKLIFPITIIVVLLAVQAILDLSLPTYTSNIVNVGITGYGIENNVPEVIREKEMNKLLMLMNDDSKKKVLDNYSLTMSSEYEYSIKNNEKLYILNDINEDIMNELNNLFITPIVIRYNIDNKIIDLNEEYLTSDTLNNIVASFDTIDESLVGNQIKLFIKSEYETVGINTNDLQNSYIKTSGIKMLLISLIIAIVAIILGFLSSKVAASFSRKLREKVVTKVMNYSTKELNDFSVASLITRSTNDIQNIQNIIAMGFRSIIYAPIMGIGAFIKVYNSTGSMSWVVGIGIGAVVIIMLVLLILVLPKTKIMQTLIDRVNLVAREILTGLPVIRTFSTEKYEEERFNKANANLTKTSLFVNKMMSLMGPIMNLIMNGMCILIIWVGAFKVDAGSIGVGDLLALIQYSMHIIFSFLIVALMSISLPRTIVSLKRIGEILTKDLSVKDKVNTKKIPNDIKGLLEFKNVSFKYPDAEENTLANLSFKAKSGKVTAIIGSTGSGKSTLVNLIPRFYDVTEGEILINGVNIKDVKQKDLRDRIGFVPQQGILFSGTMESNIKFGNGSLSDIEASKAAEIAQASEFILDKEDGYQSPISQGGKNVSGGQKQRLAIARAIASDPEIYVLDDSFSALDFKTESKLRKQLNEQTKDKTVIIVTQRVSTVINADQIIVLEKGIVQGIGNHKELLKNCEVYKEIASSQLSEEELA